MQTGAAGPNQEGVLGRYLAGGKPGEYLRGHSSSAGTAPVPRSVAAGGRCCAGRRRS